MTTQINKSEDRTTIVLSGRLDTPSTPDVEAAIMPLIEDATVKKVYIDCSELTYISSSGLRIFITLQKHFMKTGGSLVLAHLTAPVQAVFDMTGFTDIFHIE